MIYVIGGDGFVGSAYKRYFAAAGIDAAVINRSNYERYIGTACDILINANGNSKKFLAKDDPKGEFQASVASVRNSLVDFKCKKYVFLSTSDIYPDCSNAALTCEDAGVDVSRLSPYGLHKYLAELCVQHAAGDWLIVRQGGFVGEGMKKNAVFDVLHGDKLWVNPASEFQFINTDDSARLVMELIDRGVSKQIVNLTATGTISVQQIMELAGRQVVSDEGASPVRYEISVDKVSRYLKLPNTLQTVQKFLLDFRDQ